MNNHIILLIVMKKLQPYIYSFMKMFVFKLPRICYIKSPFNLEYILKNIRCQKKC